MNTITKAHPIPISAFRNSLLATCRHQQPKPDQTLGLAVSGGVDSMGLAILCKELHDEEPQRFNFKAFVVDHQARAKSSGEARQVQKNLECLGVPADVLQLAWTGSTPPLQRNNFETEARKLRFQSLGKACLDSGISSLLLGHHEDDQAETLLMRIFGGYLGPGLRGIKPRAAFPECYGIYGIHEGAESELELEKAQGTSGADRKMTIAKPGMVIHRPLLPFSKQSLTDTCKYHAVPWVEDATNQDRSATPRNAVRYLLAQRQMPTALQKASLLAVSDRAAEAHRQRETQSLDLVGSLDLGRSLDLRSGKLTLDLPRALISSIPMSPADPKQVSPQLRMLAERIAKLVSPEESVSAEQAQAIAQRLFPIQKSAENHGQRPFTGAGVYWQPDIVNGSVDKIRWTVSRQPFANGIRAGVTSIWSGSSNGITAQYGAWCLFDGRFWISVWSDNNRRIILKSFERADLALLRKGMDNARREHLERSLASAAPGSIRWTLPILISDDSDMMALPSLGIQHAFSKRDLDYSIKYRHVELG